MPFLGLPHELTPEQRLQIIAAILARGVLRLQQRRASVGESDFEKTPEKPLEPPADHLAISGETVLSVHSG